MNIWKFISARGVLYIEDKRIARKIILTNRISFIVFLLIGVFGTLANYKIPLLFYSYMLVGVLYAAPILLNHFGSTTASRLYFTIFPALSMMIGGGFATAGNDIHLGFKFALCSTIMIPTLLFDMTEKKLMLTGILWILGSFIIYDKVQAWIPISPGIKPGQLDNEITLMVNGIFSILITAVGFYYSENLNYKAEKELQHKQQILKEQKLALEQSNNSKDAIVGVVAHDLRNPVSAVLGLSEILATEEKIEPETIDMLKRAATTGLNIIDDLLEITSLEDNKKSMQKKKLELQGLLTSIIALNQILADKKDVFIRFFPTKEEIYVMLNEEKFTRVINNLLSNAVKFSNRNSTVELKCIADGEKVIVSIIDTGIGIPEKLQPYIFEKFSAARRKGTEGEQTNGLGMSITKKIVELHDGKIYFNSEVKKGTTFYIELKHSNFDYAAESESVL
jgi:signal transduction histidine kinase